MNTRVSVSRLHNSLGRLPLKHQLETRKYLVLLWLAITLVATKLLGHFAVNAGPASRAASARNGGVTLGHPVEFAKTTSSIALLGEVVGDLHPGRHAPTEVLAPG